MSEVTVDWVKLQADLQGLTLTEEEATALVPAIVRLRGQAEIARSFLTEHETTPSAAFDPRLTAEA